MSQALDVSPATGFAPLAALHVDWAGSSLEGPPYALYFFRHSEYIRWDVDNECLFEGYPRAISELWPGLLDVFPDVPLSGAMHVPGWDNRIFFFFKNHDHAAVWNVAEHRLDDETIAVQKLLPSELTAPGHFAPVHVDRDNGQIVYVFRADTYTRFTVEPGKMPTREDDGYPRKIGDGWTGGLTVAPSCAVSVRWTQRDKSLADHKLYFFLGDLYTRWDIKSHASNYRLDIPSGWKGWPEFT